MTAQISLLFRTITTFAILLSCSSQAFAAEPPSWSSSLGTSYSAAAEADLDSGGAFSSQSFGFVGHVGKNFANGASIGTALSYTTIDYDFSGSAPAPFERAEFLTLSVPLGFKVGTNGLFRCSGSLGTSTEEQADWSDGVTTSANLGYAHTFFSGRLTVGLGVGYSHGLEEDGFGPVPYLVWQISDSILLATTSNSLGLGGLELSYRFNDQFDIGLGITGKNNRFALSDQAEAAPAGFAEVSGTPIVIRASWAVTPNIAVDGYLGLTSSGELTIENSDGDEVTTTDYDSEPFIGLAISGYL